MYHFSGNIEKITIANNDYRHVLFTSKNLQLVVMSLKPNQELGSEIHDNNDQFIRIEKGKGKAIINNTEIYLEDGSAVIIPAKTKHNIINISKTEELKLYTIYSPKEHAEGLVQHNKPQTDGKKYIKFLNLNI